MKKTDWLKHYFQLLEVFTFREIKSRYKSSILGPLWIVVYPLATAIVLNFIFGKIVKIKTEGIPYFIFVLSGLVIWDFFQQGLTLAKDSLVWNRELITKAAFAKDTLPLSYILSKIPDFLVYWFILIVFYILNYHKFNPNSLFILVSVFPLIFFSAGLSLIAALANAVFRDFGRVAEFLLVVLFYATPIVYPDSFIPHSYQFLLWLNPLSFLIIFNRNILFKNQIKFDIFFISLTFSLLFFLLGFIIFKKYEKKVADLI